MHRTRVAGVVLAAGAGRRFGMPKALVQADGRFLLERAMATLREAGCAPIVVVLGARADEVRRTLTFGDAEIVVNEHWADGMSTSFRAGLRACDGVADAAVVALVDQPGVTPRAVVRLIEKWRKDDRPVVVATYAGAWRNPVLFGAAVFADVIGAVRGDVGAKPWLQANPEKVATVEVGDVSDDTDVDTPADLPSEQGPPHRVPPSPY